MRYHLRRRPKDPHERPSGYPQIIIFMAQSGTVLAERYRLIEPLGQGGMGTVWRAEHVELGSQVAVKLIDEEMIELTETLTRFKREAKAAAALNSIHIVQIFDYGVDNGVPYIAMELLKGESLGSRLDRQPVLPPAEVGRIITQVSRGLDKAHNAGIVHRDIKPDNVFLTRNEGEEEIVKILDFGVAKTISPDVSTAATSNTRTGTMVGSPSYMSPEQLRGAKSLDYRTDLWALGVITYEALVGKRPFDGDSLGDLVIVVCTEDLPVPSEHGTVPEGFDAWFAKACNRDPKQRFNSAREQAEEFLALIGAGKFSMFPAPLEEPAAPEEPVQPVRSTTGQTNAGLARTGDSPPAARKGSSTAYVVGGGLALVAVVAGVGIFVTQSRHPAEAEAIAESAAIVATVAAPPSASPSAAPDAAAPADSSSAVHVLQDGEPAASSSAAVPRANGTRTSKPAATPPTETSKPPATQPTAPAPAGSRRDYGF